jgi:uncharacterized protein YlxW (UPF0749 family)
MSSSSSTGLSSSSSFSSLQQEINEIKKEIKDLQIKINDPNVKEKDKDFYQQKEIALINNLTGKEKLILMQPNQGTINIFISLHIPST